MKACTKKNKMKYLTSDDFTLASIFGYKVHVNPRLKGLGYTVYTDGIIKDVTDKFVGVIWPQGKNICWYTPNELVVEDGDGSEEGS